MSCSDEGSNRIALIDIGTNAVRLAVFQVRGRHYRVIAVQRERARLGQGMYQDNILKDSAICRTAAACRRLLAFGRRCGASRTIAFMTAAGREAHNRMELAHAIQSAAGIRPRLLRAEEEARLIYDGIAASSGRRRGKLLAVEIGGGSTELALGIGRRCIASVTLKIGAVRMREECPEIGGRGPVPDAAYQRTVARLAERVKRATVGIRRHDPPEQAHGTGGAIASLADAATRAFRGRPLSAGDVVSTAELSEISRQLRSSSLGARRKTLGMDPGRADIIVGGAAILEAIISTLGIGSIAVSFGGLRDGLIRQYLAGLSAGNEQ